MKVSMLHEGDNPWWWTDERSQGAVPAVPVLTPSFTEARGLRPIVEHALPRVVALAPGVVFFTGVWPAEASVAIAPTGVARLGASTFPERAVLPVKSWKDP